MNENERVKKANYIGYAHFYFSQCHKESKSDDEIVKEFFTKLVELDTRLGTTPSEQLLESHREFKERVSNQMKKLSNELGGYILREAGFGFEKWKDYDWIKKETNYAGYADSYLSEYDRRSDATVYQKLVDIDAALGTDASLQLFRCINRTTRCDIIKVSNFL